MNKFTNYIKRVPKTFGASAAAIVAILSVPAIAFAGYFPNRPTYDYNKYDSSKTDCADPTNPARDFGRCGSLTGPVFNSFVNTPFYGDERGFVDARHGADTDGADRYKDILANVTAGEEIMIRMYVHNNANQTTNDDPNKGPGTFDGNGVAKNTKVRVLIPEGTNPSLRATGFISADNATPREVSDTVDFTSGSAFSLDYIEGSAFADTNAGRYALNDSIVTSGAQIGYTGPNGEFPGCFEYKAIVTLKVKVLAPGIEFNKTVAKKGAAFTEKVDAVRGEDVTWKLAFKNTGTQNIEKVTVRDQLPPYVKLVPGSVKLVNARNPQGKALADQALFTNMGVEVGDYTPGSNGYITFKTTVEDKFAECQVTITNTAWTKADDLFETPDQAQVTITRPISECKPVTPATTVKPTVLPNTGPAQTLGVFAAVTVAGAVAHSYFARRRTNS